MIKLRAERVAKILSTPHGLGREPLSPFLPDAAFAIDQQFGDRERYPLTDISSEIITIAKPTFV